MRKEDTQTLDRWRYLSSPPVSIDKLSAEIGISPAYMSMLRSANDRSPSPELAVKIIDSFVSRGVIDLTEGIGWVRTVCDGILDLTELAKHFSGRPESMQSRNQTVSHLEAGHRAEFAPLDWFEGTGRNPKVRVVMPTKFAFATVGSAVQSDQTESGMYFLPEDAWAMTRVVSRLAESGMQVEIIPDVNIDLSSQVESVFVGGPDVNKNSETIWRNIQEQSFELSYHDLLRKFGLDKEDNSALVIHVPPSGNNSRVLILGGPSINSTEIGAAFASGAGYVDGSDQYSSEKVWFAPVRGIIDRGRIYAAELY